MFPTAVVQKPSSVPTLLPARPSFGYEDNLPVQYLNWYVKVDCGLLVCDHDPHCYRHENVKSHTGMKKLSGPTPDSI
jgi:hypothetical protein